MEPLDTLTTPETDDIKMMLPDPDALSRGCASWQRWYEDSRFVAIINEYSSAEYSVVGFVKFVPTLFTCVTKMRKGDEKSKSDSQHNVMHTNCKHRGARN